MLVVDVLVYNNKPDFEKSRFLYAGFYCNVKLHSGWPTGPHFPHLPPGLTPDSVASSRLGVLLLPLDGMLVHCRLSPSILSGFVNGSLVPI